MGNFCSFVKFITNVQGKVIAYLGTSSIVGNSFAGGLLCLAIWAAGPHWPSRINDTPWNPTNSSLISLNTSWSRKHELLGLNSPPSTESYIEIGFLGVWGRPHFHMARHNNPLEKNVLETPNNKVVQLPPWRSRLKSSVLVTVISRGRGEKSTSRLRGNLIRPLRLRSRTDRDLTGSKRLQRVGGHVSLL